MVSAPLTMRDNSREIDEKEDHGVCEAQHQERNVSNSLEHSFRKALRAAALNTRPKAHGGIGEDNMTTCKAKGERTAIELFYRYAETRRDAKPAVPAPALQHAPMTRLQGTGGWISPNAAVRHIGSVKIADEWLRGD